jgi:hypothetical protein
VSTSDPTVLLTFETIAFNGDCLSSVRNVLVRSYFVLFCVSILKLPISITLQISVEVVLLSVLAQALTLPTCNQEVPGFKSRPGHDYPEDSVVFFSPSRLLPG